jgi:hypothetical protein
MKIPIKYLVRRFYGIEGPGTLSTYLSGIPSMIQRKGADP